MRIVLTIHHHLERDSGAPGSTLALAEAYRRAGHETVVLSFDDLPRQLAPQAQMLAFPFLVAARLAGSLGRWCDAVDASSGDAWLWSLLRTGRREAPILATRSHGLEQTAHLQRLADHREGRISLRRRYHLYHGGERLWEVAVSFRRADLAFFLNRVDLDYAVHSLGVSPERAHIAYNGIDEDLLGLPEPQDEVTDGKVGIAMIGRHTYEKGAPYAVLALDGILARHPEVHVTLLGTGSSAEEVRRDFDPSVRNRVAVVPAFARVDLPRLLAGHEILLFPALTEGFGKALVEAMACGLAPIAAAAPGPCEILGDGAVGVLVPPRDAESLAAAAERLLGDRDLRLRTRRNAHAAAQRYSWDVTAEARLGLIEHARDAR